MKRSRIQRKKPMRRRSRKPKAQRDAEWKAYYGSSAYVSYLHSQPCLADEDHGPAESSHLKHKSIGGDWRSQTPKCHPCHMQYHSQGPARFCEQWGLQPGDLARIAAYHAEQAITLGLVLVDEEGRPT